MDFKEKYHWITPFRYDINPDKEYGVGKCGECNRKNGRIVKYYNGSFVDSSWFGDRTQKIVHCEHCCLFTVSGDEDAKDKWK